MIKEEHKVGKCTIKGKPAFDEYSLPNPSFSFSGTVIPFEHSLFLDAFFKRFAFLPPLRMHLSRQTSKLRKSTF